MLKGVQKYKKYDPTSYQQNGEKMNDGDSIKKKNIEIIFSLLVYFFLVQIFLEYFWEKIYKKGNGCFPPCSFFQSK